MAKCNECEKPAIYGFEILSACSKHRERGMRNLYAKKCLDHTCKKIPSFGIPGKKAIFCKEHSKEGMIGLTNAKTCLISGCNTQPSFTSPSHNSPIFCKKHSSKNMINIRSKRCLDESCNRIPKFDSCANKRPKYCHIHLAKYKCPVRSCDNFADKCEEHALLSMILDLRNKS